MCDDYKNEKNDYMRIHVRPYWHKEKTNKQISIDERDTPLLAKVPRLVKNPI